MFEDALMESDNQLRSTSKYWSLLAMLINCAAMAALILWPLLHPDALPPQIMATLLVAPSPPPPTPPQAPQPKVQVQSELLDNQIQAPSRIPKAIKLVKEEASAQPSATTIMGSDEMAGMHAAALEGLFSGSGTTPPVVRPPAPRTLTISSGVMAGNLLEKTVPQYPAIPKAARIQGTVVLQATIGKTGTIQNLRVIDGPAMLQQAALDAVRTWRYKPYLLNGQPMEVETTVNVVFSLGN
jgi:periplasmic protein TonB